MPTSRNRNIPINLTVFKLLLQYTEGAGVKITESAPQVKGFLLLIPSEFALFS
jgi:hypothetical protein